MSKSHDATKATSVARLAEWLASAPSNQSAWVRVTACQLELESVIEYFLSITQVGGTRLKF